MAAGTSRAIQEEPAWKDFILANEPSTSCFSDVKYFVNIKEPWNLLTGENWLMSKLEMLMEFA